MRVKGGGEMSSCSVFGVCWTLRIPGLIIA